MEAAPIPTPKTQLSHVFMALTTRLINSNLITSYMRKETALSVLSLPSYSFLVFWEWSPPCRQTCHFHIDGAAYFTPAWAEREEKMHRRCCRPEEATAQEGGCEKPPLSWLGLERPVLQLNWLCRPINQSLQLLLLSTFSRDWLIRRFCDLALIFHTFQSPAIEIMITSKHQICQSLSPTTRIFFFVFHCISTFQSC